MREDVVVGERRDAAPGTVSARTLQPSRAIAFDLAGRAELGHVDAHETTVDADPQVVWLALGEVLWRERLPGRGFVARLLRTEPRERRGEPLLPGSTLPGLRVVRAREAHELEFEGGHRYARYSLLIRIREHEGRSVVSTESRAGFVGVGGWVYRSLVMGARTHTLLVRSMLAGVRARAEANAI
jgi:hypothetical protein